MWPDDDILLTAWRALLAASDTAGAFAALVLPPLEADLARCPAADPHHRTDAADCAVAAFLRRPEAFDPARLPLPAFLRMIARRDLANLQARYGRHHRGRVPWASVELGPPARNDEGEEADTFADHPELSAAVEALPPADRAVCDLMRAGEKATDVFAAAMGVNGLPPADRAEAVKRAKDRVMMRLKRAGRGG